MEDILAPNSLSRSSAELPSRHPTSVQLTSEVLFGNAGHQPSAQSRFRTVSRKKLLLPAVNFREVEITPEPMVAPSTCLAAPRAPWDRSLADRKLWLLKRSGLFGSNTRGATCERACTIEDFRSAYRLVHDVYLGTEFIQPEPAGLRLRIFETSPEMATFVAKANGRIVGVLSVVTDSKELGLPSDSAFKQELDELRATNVRLAEITNQSVAEEFRKSAVPTELMRCVVAHMAKIGIDKAVATVSPSHNGFYELLGFREIGGERSYSGKLHDPVVALAADVEPFRTTPEGMNETEDFVNGFLGRENPYCAHVEAWEAEAQRLFLDAKLLEKLFVEERNFIGECSDAELGMLEARWGQNLFSAVFIPSTIKLLEEVMRPEATVVNVISPETCEAVVLPPPSAVIETKPLRLKTREKVTICLPVGNTRKTESPCRTRWPLLKARKSLPVSFGMAGRFGRSANAPPWYRRLNR